MKKEITFTDGMIVEDNGNNLISITVATRIFEVDFGGKIKAKIETSGNGLKVIAAMDGGGNVFDVSKITTNEIKKVTKWKQQN